MDQLDLLRLVAETLERLGIRYAVVGSFASGAWGEPRMTHDIDVVVELDVFDAQLICNAFGADEFYVSSTAAHEAVQNGRQFKLLHPASGNKIDFMVVGDSARAPAQLERCTLAPLLSDQMIRVASPKDVVLGKLLYYSEGGSEKHLRDISGRIRTQAVAIDYEYLQENAWRLGVNEEWQSVLGRLAE